MNKYKTLDRIGTVISAFGMCTTLISACIDVDHSAPGAFHVAITGMAVGMLIFLIGYALCDFRSVEGCAMGVLMMAGAWLYKHLHIKSEMCKVCYQVVRKAGGYSDAYYLCYTAYMGEA